ncbi:hypothetical protein K492DRAFT_38544 [Lichtheimia hyalospora FSU 10163]|nr:hypothetical protein K492DRAFT_38544 [Lichtheimia hyalospora FSU 10163]
MATNSNQHHSVATAGRSPLSYTSSSLRSAPGSRRERLRSFARATSQVIKQEISKYYESPPTSSDDHSSIGDTDSISSQPRPTMESTGSLPPSRPGVVRNRTQSMNDLEPSNSSSTGTITPDSGKPHCMLFPTYACKTIDHNNQTTWRVRLAGWTFALPGSSRIERWILAAGRTYGGLSANSAEDVHFARLLNQFRCQTMRSVDLLLSVVDVIPVERALVYQHQSSSSSSSSTSSTCSLPDTATTTDTSPSTTTSTPSSHSRNPFSLHHIRDKATDALKAFMINSGPTGRFEHLLTLDLSHTIHDATRKMLRLKASFDNRLDATHHDGYVDLIEPEGISIISVNRNKLFMIS